MIDHMPPEVAFPAAIVAVIAYLALKLRARGRGERS